MAPIAVRVLLLAMALASLVCGSAWAQPMEPRIALVIGNNNYRFATALRNAGNDARSVARDLAARGFVVMDGYNLDRGETLRLINRFTEQLSRYEVALFYFAGHGVQLRGGNFLVPVNAKPDTEVDLADDSVAVADVAERMARGNPRGFNLLIIDACRDNPFRAASRSLGADRGLGAPSAANGVMILHSAGSNQVALDNLGANDTDANSVFTRELLKVMREPGVPVREMMTRLRNAVQRSSAGIGRVQVPALYDEALGDFVFTPVHAKSPEQPAAPPPPLEASIELEFWRSAQRLNTREAYQNYLNRYPHGVFADLARLAIPVPAASVQPASPIAAAPPPVAPMPSRPAAELPPVLIQFALAALGFYSGPTDGQLGPMARRAIEAWQRSAGASVTGTLTPQQVVALVQSAAEKGQAESQNTLGMMLAAGIGLPKDEAAAIGWFSKAAATSAQGKFNLAVMLRDGRGATRDPERALALLRQARDQGYEPAGIALMNEAKRP